VLWYLLSWRVMEEAGPRGSEGVARRGQVHTEGEG
jgi:hypothetical protein